MVTVERLAAPFRRPAMLDDLVGGVLAAYDARRPRSTASDRKLIVRAGKVAEQSHLGQLRQTGEPYITHPVAVATIVAELGLDARSVASAVEAPRRISASRGVESLLISFALPIRRSARPAAVHGTPAAPARA